MEGRVTDQEKASVVMQVCKQERAATVGKAQHTGLLSASSLMECTSQVSEGRAENTVLFRV